MKWLIGKYKKWAAGKSKLEITFEIITAPLIAMMMIIVWLIDGIASNKDYYNNPFD